MYSLRG